MPCFSLAPNKLTLYNRVFKSSEYDKDGNKKDKVKRNNTVNFEPTSNDQTVKRQSHNLQISPNAYRTLTKKITWLYYLSKSRNRTTYNGKQIYNFKLCFLTLTLPSKQQTSTAEVTANIFNTMLTELRQRTSMTNYVWRMEYQKNGNVHYHLCTDTYLDYFFVLPIWNRILSHHGYIEPYRAKHADLSLHQYNQLYNSDGHKEFATIAKQYAKGKKNKWTQPNSIDCKSVISKKAIASYISKYFGKSENDTTIKNEFDTPENVANIRLWFCSRSLSRVENISDFCEGFSQDVVAIIDCAKNTHKFFAKWATVIYYELHNLPDYCRQVLEPIMRNHAYSTGYIPDP